MRYFLKEIVTTALYLPGGYHFPFETVGDQGIWATDDKFLCEEADKAIRAGIGGIAEIDQEQYDELAKKKSGGPSPLSLFAAPRPAAQMLPSFQAPQALPPIGPSVVPAAGAGDPLAKPLEVPGPQAFKRPKLAKAGPAQPTSVTDAANAIK